MKEKLYTKLTLIGVVLFGVGTIASTVLYVLSKAGKIGMSDKLALLLVFVLLVFAALCLLAYFFFYKASKLDAYEREFYYNYKLNRSVLVSGDAYSIDVKGYVKVNSFKEILKVQENLSLPIIYTKKENECRYVIKSGTSGYYYDSIKK